MRVGMVGLGKLGLPVSYAMCSRGLEVFGYDPKVWHQPKETSHEQGLAEAIEQSAGRMHFVGMEAVVGLCDAIFVAVQTPHEPQFEGITPLTDERADFDYSYLKRAVTQLVHIADKLDRRITLAVISTVLPGTMKREIQPLLSERVSLVYNPSFIAMGTTIQDFLDPEFVLLGGDEAGQVRAVYRQVLDTDIFATDRGDTSGQFYLTSIENAELIKVAYNTFIGLKIAFANTLMEVCHKTDCDVDEVTDALALAKRRLISPAYMKGGMGDGGACHPRDNIALSWLARELDLSHDLFEDVMACRENQAEWLADELMACAAARDLDVGILGFAYKPGSRITTGSAAMLVANIIHERVGRVFMYDPHSGPKDWLDGEPPRVYLVGCKHPEFPIDLPRGSVVIDPFRFWPDQPGVEVIRIGERTSAHDRQTVHGRAMYPLAA